MEKGRGGRGVSDRGADLVDKEGGWRGGGEI